MNRGGGKFFRPQGPDNDNTFDSDGSSDDSDDYDGDDAAPVVSAPVASASALNKSKQSANLSSSDDEDSDHDNDNDNDNDSDDDDDDNDNVPTSNTTNTSNTSNKRKNAPSNNNNNKSNNNKSKKAKQSFIDEEAEASDDDSIEEEDYGTHHDPHDRVKKIYTQEDIRRENMDDEALAIINRQNRRRNHLAQFAAEDDAEDVARQIEERHRMASHRVDIDRRGIEDASMDINDGGNQHLSAVSQQSLLPSVSDPSLWMFGCMTGKEQELVYQIMNKCIAYARQGKPLGITSTVAAQSKGRIYIESFSEPAVREAVQGIRGLMVYSMRLVPISDMTTVMTVTPKRKPGKWVLIVIAILFIMY